MVPTTPSAPHPAWHEAKGGRARRAVCGYQQTLHVHAAPSEKQRRAATQLQADHQKTVTWVCNPITWPAGKPGAKRSVNALRFRGGGIVRSTRANHAWLANLQTNERERRRDCTPTVSMSAIVRITAKYNLSTH